MPLRPGSTPMARPINTPRNRSISRVGSSRRCSAWTALAIISGCMTRPPPYPRPASRTKGADASSPRRDVALPHRLPQITRNARVLRRVTGRIMRLSQNHIFCAIAAALLSFGATGFAAAQSPTDFYKNRNIDEYIGYSPGGAYDFYARVIGRHMGAHIPGNPTLVPRNMEGAGSLRLAHWVYRVAPQDGSAFGTIGRGIAFDPLLIGKGDQFDAQKFNWLGSANNEVSVCVARTDSGITKFEDLFTKELAVGGTGTSAAPDQFPPVLNNLLGTHFKVTEGYPGGTNVVLAMSAARCKGAAAGRGRA